MPWAGGNYTKGNNGTGGWVGDASLGIGIEAGRHDTQDNDFATGINQCINKDGSNAFTADANLGGFKPTNIAAGTAAAPAICAGGDVNTGIFSAAADTIGIATNGTERVRIGATGRVGIGTNGPGAVLDIRTPYADSQDFLVGEDLGGGNWYFRCKLIGRHTTGSGTNVVIDANNIVQKATSSLKYKKDIVDYTKGLEDVLKLRAVSYKGINDGERIFAGLIAEEVHDAGFTEFVVYDVDEQPDALHYGNMVALAFKAIQELNAKVEALEARVAELEA